MTRILVVEDEQHLADGLRFNLEAEGYEVEVVDNGEAAHTQPTIYDVARAAGVSIASVSRVLNDRRSTLPETRARVLQAVTELGFIPDGAARALSGRLKEIVGVVIRRPTATVPGGDFYADEDESLQFPDLINRGIEVAAQHRDFNLLVSSVDVDDHDYSRRIFALARKSDGLILHDQVIGTFNVESPEPRAFTESDLMFLEIFTRDVAVARPLTIFLRPRCAARGPGLAGQPFCGRFLG